MLDDTGWMYYNARYYDPYLNRWTQPDTIVPEPGNPQTLNRYAFVLNNPIRYTDPTGHFSIDEMCQYWGYCGDNAYDEALNALGQSLFSVMWNTEITWGDFVFLDNGGGNTVTAEFLLLSNERNGLDYYSGGMWDVNGGVPMYGSDYVDAVGRHVGSGGTTSWIGTVSQAATPDWLSGHGLTVPDIQGVTGLPNWSRDEYVLSTYIDLGFWWWVDVAVGIAALPTPAAPIVSTAAAALAVTGYTSDVLGWKLMGGPVDATYPVAYRTTLAQPGRTSAQFHFTAPRATPR